MRPGMPRKFAGAIVSHTKNRYSVFSIPVRDFQACDRAVPQLRGLLVGCE